MDSDTEKTQYDSKANEALAQLSLSEKVALLSGSPRFWIGLADMMTGGYSRQAWPAGEAAKVGAPGLRFTDGPRGVVLQGATTFPVSMARGAAWDPDLEERVGDAIGREMRACGANLFGGVCINLLRHPAWGRAQETYGEDSYHLGMMGAALVRGVQRHVMACAKHYACNSMENARFKVDVQADARTLREVYLPHFKRCVDAGVAAVMTSYNSVNGEWCGQNHVLIRDILKDDWGFQGFTLTDFIFGMRDAKKAILAGQDLEMPFRSLYTRDLQGLVERGEVPMELVDDAARRILRQEFRFEHRDGDYSREVVGCAAHRQLALEAAEKSIVLLQNKDSLLPLKGRERVAVIGRLADTPNTGDRGSSNTQPKYVVTPLQGLRDLMPESQITYDDARDPKRAARIAAEADVALVVVGYTHLDEGEFISPGSGAEIAKLFPAPSSPEEAQIAGNMMKMMTAETTSGNVGAFSAGGDRDRLELRPEDEALIREIAAANPRTIVAIMAGSAVIMESWREQAAAILMLWYPGMEGGRALARILLGAVNPSGRLPCTFPRRSEDLPEFDREATSVRYDLWHGYRKLERDGVTAAFPFGYGLSYTTFEYSELSAGLGAGAIHARLTVTNTGAVAGEEVVQVYVRTPGLEVPRAKRELKAFSRVHLDAGASAQITFEIPVSELAYFDEASGWRIEPGSYVLLAGRHAEDAQALSALVAI